MQMQWPKVSIRVESVQFDIRKWKKSISLKLENCLRQATKIYSNDIRFKLTNIAKINEFYSYTSHTRNKNHLTFVQFKI